MSAVLALREAQAAGVAIRVEGDDLVLEAVSPPPFSIIECLARHKPEIVALLRLERGSWSDEDWRAHFEERAAIAEYDGGLPRQQAEVGAYENCLIEWLDLNSSSDYQVSDTAAVMSDLIQDPPRPSSVGLTREERPEPVQGHAGCPARPDSITD